MWKLWTQKSPDQAIETYVYNKRGLPAYTQDGHLLAKGQWMGTQYDPYGRVVNEGFSDSTPGVNESFDDATITELLNTNTYGTTGVEIDKLVTNTSKLLHAEDANIIRHNEYDACGRLAHTYGNTILQLDHINSHDMVTTYDDADHVLTTTEQIPHNSAPLTLLKSYAIDHAGRPTTETIQINNFAQQTLSSQTYTAKEQVNTLTLGDNLQTVDYNYLSNGFLQSINDPTALGSDLFGIQLGYDQATSTLTPGTIIRKDGNITSAIWKTSGGSSAGYNYDYDYHSWLLSADYYQSGNNGAYSTSYV